MPAAAPKRRISRLRSAKSSISASRVAAQHAVPIAIAVAEVAAAEGRFRAVIKLIVDAAMIRAIGPAGEILRRAMVTEPRRQLLGRLPVDADDKAACRVQFAGACGRCRQGGGQGGEHKNFLHRASPHSLVRDRTDCRASGGAAIDGASATAAVSIAAAGIRGKRMENRAPSPSLLSTVTAPPCMSTTILTRYRPTPVPTIPETLPPR